MDTDIIPMIVALAVTTILVAPVICLFIKHPPKPVDPCKVIDAFGNAVEAGRQQRKEAGYAESESIQLDR